MKKLVYITQCQLQFNTVANECDGALKKIFSQYEIFNKAFDTYMLGYVDNRIGMFHNNQITILNSSKGKTLRKFKLYNEAKKFILQNTVTYCYIRYGLSNGRFISMLKTIKKNGSEIIVEIPTFPYSGELRCSLKEYLLKVVDSRYQKQLHLYVDKISTYSNDKLIFGIPCINIVNGICIEKVSPRTPIPKSDMIHLICVSYMERFHGYDRFITGLYEYYQNGGTREIIFHLVGEGPELPNYKKSTLKYHLEDRVIFHGFQSGAELDHIFNQSDIAVECLGCHRKNIFLSSSLKSREYAARGMPMITSCKIDVFPENYPYLLNISADESPVNMNQVIKFYDKIYRESQAEELIQNIRNFALTHCDMAIVMKPIIDFYNSEL